MQRYLFNFCHVLKFLLLRVKVLTSNYFFNAVYFKKKKAILLKPKKNQTFNSVNNELVVGVYKKGFYNYNSVTNSFKNQVSRNEFIYGAHQIKPLNTTFYALGESLVIIKNGKKRIIDFTKFNKQKIFINEIGRKLVYYNNSLYGNFAFGINKLKKKRIKPKKRIPVSKTKRKEFIDLFSK